MCHIENVVRSKFLNHFLFFQNFVYLWGTFFDGLWEESEIIKEEWYLLISPCLITLPFFIFFAEKRVNSHKKHFLWGEDLSVRGNDNGELVLIFSEVVFVWLATGCQILFAVSDAQYCMLFWLPTISRIICVRAGVSHFLNAMLSIHLEV